MVKKRGPREPYRRRERRGICDPPEEITVALLECVVMPSGEVICIGKSLGWVKQLGPYLTKKERT